MGASTAIARCASSSTARPTWAGGRYPGLRAARQWRAPDRAARSNITGRAASSPPVPKSRMRWWTVAAMRPASRPICAPPKSTVRRADRARARIAGRSLRATSARINDAAVARSFPPASTTRRSCGRAQAWKALYEPAIRPRRRPGPCTHSTRSGSLCPALCALRPARRGWRTGRIAAALAAADSGARIILCDEPAEFGGSLLADTQARIEGQAPPRGCRPPCALRAKPRVTLLARTTAFGYFPHNLIGLNQRLNDHLASPAPGEPRERLWQVRAKSVVLAAGAIERPLVFPGNDRPGIMFAGAAQHLSEPLWRQGGRAWWWRPPPIGYRAALELQAAGVKCGGRRGGPESRAAGCMVERVRATGQCHSGVHLARHGRRPARRRSPSDRPTPLPAMRERRL